MELGKALTAIEQDDGGVTATITHYKNKGPTQETEVLRAKFLLGCDGARGVSRKLLGLSFEGETKYAEGQVWGDVEIDGLTNDVSAALPSFAATTYPQVRSFGIFGVSQANART